MPQGWYFANAGTLDHPGPPQILRLTLRVRVSVTPLRAAFIALVPTNSRTVKNCFPWLDNSPARNGAMPSDRSEKTATASLFYQGAKTRATVKGIARGNQVHVRHIPFKEL